MAEKIKIELVDYLTHEKVLKHANNNGMINLAEVDFTVKDFVRGIIKDNGDDISKMTPQSLCKKYIIEDELTKLGMLQDSIGMISSLQSILGHMHGHTNDVRQLPISLN